MWFCKTKRKILQVSDQQIVLLFEFRKYLCSLDKYSTTFFSKTETYYFIFIYAKESLNKNGNYPLKHIISPSQFFKNKFRFSDNRSCNKMAVTKQALYIQLHINPKAYLLELCTLHKLL